MAKATSKPKKVTWFIKTRGSYLPSSVAGWLTYIPFVGYLVFALVAGIKTTNSAAAAILFIVPNWVAATVVMSYLAARKS